MSPRNGPIAGIRIVDLTSVILGPFATQILASLGADVVKVESPEGDNMRHVGPMRHTHMGPIFLHANQGKRSVVLDLKQAAAQEALHALLAEADVLITNIRPHAMQRLGFSYKSLSERYPRLICVSCCGFDQKGPYAQRPAYDDLIQGAVGVPWLSQQYSGGAPSYAPMTLADRVTGLHAVYAVTAALYAREKTGMGQEIVVPMFEAMTQFILGDHFAGLSFEPPLGSPGYARLLTQHRRPYRTADGWLCVLIYNDKHWRNFFAAVGDLERMQDAMFATHAARAAHIDDVYAEVAQRMRERTTAQWIQLLDRADIPNMPMASPEDLLHDMHHTATGFIQKIEHPSEGTMYTTRAPTQWSGTPLDQQAAPAPQLGEHTADVLKEAGLSAAEIHALIESSAAVQHAMRSQ